MQRLVGLSHEINKVLNSMRNNFTTVACMFLYMFGLNMGDLFAQSYKLTFPNKITTHFCGVTAKALNISDVLVVGINMISLSNSLDIRQPLSEKSSKVNTAFNSSAAEGESIRYTGSNYARTRESQEERWSIEWHSFLVGCILGVIPCVCYFLMFFLGQHLKLSHGV